MSIFNIHTNGKSIKTKHENLKKLIIIMIIADMAEHRHGGRIHMAGILI